MAPSLAHNLTDFMDLPGPARGPKNVVYPAIVPSTTSSDFEISESTTISELPLTGTNAPTSVWCGQVRHTIVCPDGHHKKLIRSTCGDPLCRECADTWITRAADRAQSRIMGYMDAGGTSYYPNQIVLSLPKSDYRPGAPHESEMQRLKNVFRKKATEIGIIGGAMVIHIFRVKKGYKRFFNDKASQLNESGKRTNTGRKFNLYDVLKTLPNWRDFVYFSPHAHIIGYGYIQEPVKGDVWKWKKVVKRPLKDGEDVKRLVFYLLTHATPVSGKHAITYFGGCSYNKLVTVHRQTIHDALTCPICGREMVYADENGIPYPHMEVYLVKRLFVIYEIRDPGGGGARCRTS